MSTTGSCWGMSCCCDPLSCRYHRLHSSVEVRSCHHYLLYPWAQVRSISTTGVPALLVGRGHVGSGSVMSWSLSGQNSRILSKRYHPVVYWRGLGVTWHDEFLNKLTSSSGLSDCVFTNLPRVAAVKLEVVKLLDSRDLLQVWSEEVSPVKHWDNSGTIICRHKRYRVALSRFIDYLCNTFQTTNRCSPVCTLEETTALNLACPTTK